MRVKCTIDTAELENDSGHGVEGIVATCTRCNHETESFGTASASVRRCLALMREECPEGEDNFYLADGQDDD